LVYTGKYNDLKGGLSVIRYNQSECETFALAEPPSVLDERFSVNWINLTGLSDIPLVEKTADNFGVHPLLQEDMLNTSQRPKIESFKEHLFVTLKMLSINSEGHIESEHISFVLGKNYVLSFQETPNDLFDTIRDRIKKDIGIVRNQGADYLLYLLLDVIIDHYFIITDQIVDRIEKLEDEINLKHKIHHSEAIQQIRNDLLMLRKLVSPVRDMMGVFTRKQCLLIKDDVSPFFFDLSDHVYHLSELIETYRDMNTGLKDMYINSISLQTNRVMQTLTIVTVIFIPLSFLASIYGMNFDNMPELHHPNGYYYLIAVMTVIALAMLFLFKRRRWL
jgi:magnesium transporter